MESKSLFLKAGSVKRTGQKNTSANANSLKCKTVKHITDKIYWPTHYSNCVMYLFTMGFNQEEKDFVFWGISKALS